MKKKLPYLAKNSKVWTTASRRTVKRLFLEMDGPHIRVNKELVELNVYSNQEKNISINSEVQRVGMTTPRGTVNQELKLLTMHLILNWFGW